MTRTLQPHHLEIAPTRHFSAYPEDNLDGWGDLEDAKRPFFQKGDVVAILDADSNPQRGVVIYCGRDHSDRTGDWIPIYKLRLYKRDGTLGMAWRWAWPGHIQRGLDALNERVAA